MKYSFTFVPKKVAHELDQTLLNKYKLASEIAMELAGQAVAHAFTDFFSNKLKLESRSPGKVLVIAGPGSKFKRQWWRCAGGSSPFEFSVSEKTV